MNTSSVARHSAASLAPSVINAGSGQAILVRKIQPPVFDTSGADGRLGDNPGPVSQITDSLSRDEFAAHALTPEQDLRPEFAGLLARAFRQFRAADSVRKSEVVFDFGTARGLPANRVSFD
jgi:hypothetical protein